MYGVIDIGSNTIRLQLYNVNEKGKLQSVMNKKYMAGLANYIDSDGALKDEGQEILIDTLLELKQIVENVKLEGLYVFATASLRNIINSEETVDRIEAATSWRPEVISGDAEARYGYYGLIQEPEDNITDGMSADIGGGSTELSFFSRGSVVSAYSMPVGSLNLYNRYVGKIMPSSAEMRRIREEAEKRVAKISAPQDLSADVLYCEGGSARAINKVIRVIYGDELYGETYKKKYLSKFLKFYKEERRRCLKILLKVSPDRLHTIIPGALVLRSVVSRFGCKHIYTASGGVREGYLWCKLNGVNVSDK